MDTIKTIGKDLRATKKPSDYIINRVSKNFPLLERTSDYITTTFPFKQEFKTYHTDDQVYLNLQIKDGIVGLPVPCDTCTPGECICGITDTFNRTVTIANTWGTSDSGLVWET